jgi:hypothetical protein
MWKPHGKTSLCWIFHYINDNAQIDLVNPQIMRCILCCQNLVIGINPITQMRKGLISYYETNGITSFKKHTDIDHSFIATMFVKKVNSLLKST